MIALLGAVSTQECTDGTGVDIGGDGCEWYYENSDSCGFYDSVDFTASNECCACLWFSKMIITTNWN